MGKLKLNETSKDCGMVSNDHVQRLGLGGQRKKRSLDGDGTWKCVAGAQGVIAISTAWSPVLPGAQRASQMSLLSTRPLLL